MLKSDLGVKAPMSGCDVLGRPVLSKQDWLTVTVVHACQCLSQSVVCKDRCVIDELQLGWSVNFRSQFPLWQCF